MKRVKVLGAGSAGNHISHAFRRKGWNVTVADPDPKALERTRNQTYPNRYGFWDDSIVLAHPDSLNAEPFTVTVIATPPESHVELALKELKTNAPQVLLIEKPLAKPNDSNLTELRQLVQKTSTRVLVGYNHNLSTSFQALLDAIAKGAAGLVHTINVDVRENSKFILNAHPWLNGIQDSYLSSSAKGGGAAYEHSHGVSMWLYLAEACDISPIMSLQANQRLNTENNFDDIMAISFTNERGHCGSLTQDFISVPPLKRAEIFGDKGRITWTNVFNANHEELTIATEEGTSRQTFPKQRETDFVQEVNHIEDVLADKITNSPISFERGYFAGLVLERALESAKDKQSKTVE